MAKININFNNTNYSIDESSLSVAVAELQSHLSTVMNGTGATIELDGQSYGVDSAKLTAATTDFVTHLGNIAGSGSKVAVGGVEYSIDSTKVAGAISELEEVLGNLRQEALEGDGQEFHKFAPAPLTFRSTAPLNELQEVQINGVTVDQSNYTTEEGSTIVTLPIEYLKTLNADSYEITVVSDSKAVSGNFSVVEPDLNEYGFYYNQPYTAYVSLFNSNGAFFIRDNGTVDIIDTNSGGVLVGTYTVSESSLSFSSNQLGTFTGIVSDNGREIYVSELATTFVLGDESILSDEEYIYVYNSALEGYVVSCIDKNKTLYNPIKTGIHGFQTVKLADRFLEENINLVSIPVVPNSVAIIGNAAFWGCTGLTNVIIPCGVTSINDSAFVDCSSITNLTIPSSVIHIDSDAFAGCAGVTNVVYIGTVEQWNAVNIADPDDFGSFVTKEIVCSDGVVSLE